MPLLYRYAFAPFAVAVTAALRMQLEPLLGDSAPLLAFMLPVGVVAVYCGMGPGILATLLSALVGVFLFIDGFGFAPMGAADLTRVLLFIVIGLTLSILGGKLKDAKEKAQAQAEQLERLDKEKDAFIAALGHELRNPLSAVKSALTFMRKSRLDAPLHDKAAEVMERQLSTVNVFLDELLDASRFRLGLIKCDRQPLDLKDVVEDATDQSIALLEAQKVRLVFHVPDKPHRVSGDRLRLAQALSNLLVNAAKYTPAGGTVTVKLSGDDASVFLIVEDTGMGIEPALLAHIFESFVQEQRSLGRSQGGLGLGLSIVKQIVELHGGSVSAQSDGPSMGSRFRIALPRIPDLASDPERNQNPTGLNRPEFDLAERTISAPLQNGSADSQAKVP